MSRVIEQIAGSNRSFDNYQQAVALFEEINELEGTAHCYLKMGDILYNWGDLKGALKRYQRGQKVAQQVGAETIGAKCLLKMGCVFETWENPERAMHYYQTALAVFQQTMNQKGIAHCVRQMESCARKLSWQPRDG